MANSKKNKNKQRDYLFLSGYMFRKLQINRFSKKNPLISKVFFKFFKTPFPHVRSNVDD